MGQYLLELSYRHTGCGASVDAEMGVSGSASSIARNAVIPYILLIPIDRCAKHYAL
jgi:hypothetical protein